jgi:50S ribosomal protein L16 3-hydroxylase
MAFSRYEKDGRDTLYINGCSYRLPRSSGEFLPVITHYRELHFGYLQEWLEQPEYLSLLCRLYNEGHFLFSDDN